MIFAASVPFVRFVAGEQIIRHAIRMTSHLNSFNVFKFTLALPHSQCDRLKLPRLN